MSDKHTTGLAPFTDVSRAGELYRDTETNELWQVIGWITHPAAILVNRRTGEQHVEVIGCRNAERFVSEGHAELVANFRTANADPTPALLELADTMLEFAGALIDLQPPDTQHQLADIQIRMVKLKEALTT
jgi:hypothetical protein